MDCVTVLYHLFFYQLTNTRRNGTGEDSLTSVPLVVRQWHTCKQNQSHAQVGALATLAHASDRTTYHKKAEAEQTSICDSAFLSRSDRATALEWCESAA